MSIGMYAASVPVFERRLRALDTVFAKGAAFATARRMQEGVVLQLRLYPDMFPLVRQLQIATDFARNTPALLAGVEAPSFADDESRFDDCAARIQRTLAWLADLRPEQFEGSAQRPVERTIRGEVRRFTGESYLQHFALPHFYFHVTTAYAILRSIGVEIGKRDFIGPLD